VPLVSTAIAGSGVDWVNQDGITGLVVPPSDAEALAHALQWLIDHPEKAQSMGNAGRLRLETHFTIQRTASALDNVYDQAGALPEENPR
jgi:rhamnosyl/mannosyltransferase